MDKVETGIDREKHGLCLLSLDGGGVRGLSTLYILQGLMKRINLERTKAGLSKVKPCEVFDLIGGTSTGGLIAIMLGRLEMDVESCIDAYTRLMGDVFGKRKKPIDWRLNVKGQFSSKDLETAIKSLIPPREDAEKALLNDSLSERRACRVFVCAVRKSNKSLARFRSYSCDAYLTEEGVTIWQAARATSAATSFFDPITIGEGAQGREYVDGALGFNNPLDEVWLEAQDIWTPEDGKLESMLKCIVSIGTGNPGTSTIGDKPWTILETLKDIATSTENTERVFAMKHKELLINNERRYFRFNVEQGLQNVGLEEHERQGDIVDATMAYLNDHQVVRNQFRDCALNLCRKEFWYGKKTGYHKLAFTFPDSSINPFKVTFYLSDAPEIDYFTGRESIMTSMERILLPFDEPRRKIVVLYGLGGIGKTQSAIHFAKQHKQNYTAVLWFNAKDEDTLRQSFRQHASRIREQTTHQLLLDDSQDLSSPKKLVHAVKRWLALPRNDQWLLIFDNVDNPKIPQNHDQLAYDIRSYFPEAHHGSIIVTTRWASLRIGKLVEISKLLDHKHSLQILAQTSGRVDIEEEPEVWDLVETLDGLPLALATAGTYLSLESIAISEYLHEYRQSWSELQRTTPELLSYEDRTLYSTWNISYNHIAKQQDEAAVKLMRLWAYFDNQDLWFELLASGVEYAPVWLNRTVQSKLTFNAAMRKLCDHNLIYGLRDSGGYGMHPCVHAWIANVLNNKIENSNISLALNCIGSLVPTAPAVGDSAIKRRLLPHANRCLRLLSVNNQTGAIFEIANPSDIEAFHNLGLLYSDQGKLQEAEAMYQRALKGKEKAYGPDHTSALDTVNNLGALYSDQGKLQEAELMYQRALKGYEKDLGPDHTSTFDTVNNLGNLYSVQGKLQEAEAMYQRALKGKEKAYGPDHTSTLDTVNNLGALYSKQGKLQEAEAMYQRALKGCEKAYGPDHTSTFDTVNNLGNLYSDQGKLQEAEAMYQRALKGKEKAYGPDHTSTLDIINNLGLLYSDQGKLQEAETMYQRALKGYEKAWGPDHTSTLDTVNNLGALYSGQGKQQEAEAMYQRALKGYEKAYGPDHTSTLDTVNNLGNLYSDQGKLQEAEAMYQRALKGYEKSMGSAHPITLIISGNLQKLRKEMIS